MVKLTNQQIIECALEMGETEFPYSGLVAHVRQKYKVSAKTSSTAINRSLDEEVIKQEWSSRWTANTGHHSTGTLNMKVSFCRWVISDE